MPAILPSFALTQVLRPLRARLPAQDSARLRVCDKTSQRARRLEKSTGFVLSATKRARLLDQITGLVFAPPCRGGRASGDRPARGMPATAGGAAASPSGVASPEGAPALPVAVALRRHRSWPCGPSLAALGTSTARCPAPSTGLSRRPLSWAGLRARLTGVFRIIDPKRMNSTALSPEQKGGGEGRREIPPALAITPTLPLGDGVKLIRFGSISHFRGPHR